MFGDQCQPKSLVTLYLNHELLAMLTSKQEAQLCVPFQRGDVLRIEERYGKMAILSVAVSCEAAAAAKNLLFKSRPCAAGDRVYFAQSTCFHRSFTPARVENILDEKHAIILLDEKANAIPYRSMSFSRLWLTADSSGPRCS